MSTIVHGGQFIYLLIEKLQAIASPMSEWIGQLQSRFILHQDSLTEKIDVAIKRGSDFQLVAGLVYCCESYPKQEFPSSSNLEKWLSRDTAPTQQLKDDVTTTLTAFWHIANNAGLNAAFKDVQKRVAPAEFVFTGEFRHAYFFRAVACSDAVAL